jgi:transposase
MAVRSQCIEDFIYALVCCLAFLGGVPIILVPDNLKSAIIKANRYEPDVNRALEDFCNHYNMAVIPTRVASPKDYGNRIIMETSLCKSLIYIFLFS